MIVDSLLSRVFILLTDRSIVRFDRFDRVLSVVSTSDGTRLID